MAWRGQLDLHYTREGPRLRALDRHEGPLRVLKCRPLDDPGSGEHVLVHPPGGLAAGDELTVTIDQGPDTQVRLTTPGATRCYRSTGAWADQTVRARIGEGSLLEWLPLETIAHGGCRVRTALEASLEPGARMIGWDVVCLGLPAAGDAFTSGEVHQRIALKGLWLDQARVRAEDHRLRQSPLGLQGRAAWATLWCATGHPWTPAERERLLEAARAVHAGAVPHFGATSPHESLVVVRALTDAIEPVMQAFRQVREGWWSALSLGRFSEPRIWRL